MEPVREPSGVRPLLAEPFAPTARPMHRASRHAGAAPAPLAPLAPRGRSASMSHAAPAATRYPHLAAPWGNASFQQPPQTTAPLLLQPHLAAPMMPNAPHPYPASHPPLHVAPYPAHYPPPHAAPYPAHYPPSHAAPYPAHYPPSHTTPYPAHYPPPRAAPYPAHYPPPHTTPLSGSLSAASRRAPSTVSRHPLSDALSTVSRRAPSSVPRRALSSVPCCSARRGTRRCRRPHAAARSTARGVGVARRPPP